MTADERADRAVALLRELVTAWDWDAKLLGHEPLPGDAAVSCVLALGIDPFLAELDGDPYFTKAAA